jgi:CubicO group peptidase (beta-lactamase class C family)
MGPLEPLFPLAGVLTMRRVCTLACVVLVLGCHAVRTRDPGVTDPVSVGLDPEKLRAIHALLDGLVAQKKIAGGVALVARRGEVAYLDAVGSQDVEAGKPMTPGTIFRICSMTKPITSVAVMMLEEDGFLALGDPVSRFLPELKSMKVAVAEKDAASGQTTWKTVPAQREITIRDLLTHTSGLTYGFWGREHLGDLYQQAKVSDGLVETPGTMADNVRRLATVPLKSQPGAAWEYSLSTDVLGLVVEVVSGLTLDEFFQRRIFGPLGMRDTFFRIPRDKLSRLAAVYEPGANEAIERIPEGSATRGAAIYSTTYPYRGEGKYFSGGAGLVSTARDYSRFLLMLARGGELDGVRLLRRDTVTRMTSNQCAGLDLWIKAHGDGFGFGFGVVTDAAKDAGLGSPGTFSWGGFYNTYFFVDPREQLVGIVLTQLYPWDHLKLWDDFRKLAYASLQKN